MADGKYFFLIALHTLIGFLIYVFPPLSIIYAFLTLFVGVYYVVKSRNRNNEILFVCAYIVGSEVFLRMTGGNLVYELAKYSVIFFLFLGIYFSGFSKKSIPFWLYTLLLLPGVIVATETLNVDSNFRTRIAFNLSGPICLGIAAIYCFGKTIKLKQLNNMLLAAGLPIVAMTVYLIFYTPDLKSVITGTESNFDTSGGFGPNQVSTVLGLGMFIFFSRLLLGSKSKLMFIFNLIIVLNISYRGLVTFSRGGMITGFIMIIILLVYAYIHAKSQGRLKLSVLTVFIAFVFGLTWLYTSSQTGGLIDKRYGNKNALGKDEESKFSGREKIWDTEIDAFLEHPLFGVGVGKAKEIREDIFRTEIASHSEISRTLAEHGAFGIVALLIVFATPLVLYFDNKQNIYLFCFIIFWLLTINHAAMRIAAPAFIYSLSLLKVNFED